MFPWLTGDLMISNTNRMILCALLDKPLPFGFANVADNLEALLRDGLIARTATGYVINAKGRAALRWA